MYWISPFWMVPGAKMVNVSPVWHCRQSKMVNLTRLHPACLPAEGQKGGLLGDMSPSKGVSEVDLNENQTAGDCHRVSNRRWLQLVGLSKEDDSSLRRRAGRPACCGRFRSCSSRHGRTQGSPLHQDPRIGSILRRWKPKA